MRRAPSPSVRPVPHATPPAPLSPRRVVVVAALCFDFKTCIGIETLPELHQGATLAKNKLLGINSTQASKIQLILADVRSADYSDADVVFVNATCFFPASWDQVVTHLNELKPGARILVSSKALETKDFILLKEKNMSMSWGTTSMRLYQKK